MTTRRPVVILRRAMPAAMALLLSTALAFAATATEIRVVLDEGATSQVVSGELAWTTGDGDNIGGSRGAVTIGLSGNEVSLRLDGRTHYVSRLIARATGGHVQYKGHAYRGRLEFFPGKAGGVVVLNVLALEDYLLGVVPAEMPASWPTAALRAQAVAARTYALSRMMAQRNATFDVLATVSDQAYRGVSGEDPRSNAAVRDTAGQILTYGGLPIIAYFSADAGGYTRAGSQPYLRPVPCPSSDSPHNNWQFELNAAELSELAAAAGAGAGPVTAVIARHAAASGHLQSLTLNTGAGSCTLQGAELRRYIGRGVMKSTRIELTPLGSASVSVSIEEQPGIAAPPAASASFGTAVLQDYERPWVVSGRETGGIKLRTMYASNGWDLRKCTGSIHAFSSILDSPAASDGPVAASARQPAASVTRIEGQGALDGLVITGSGYGHGRGLSQWGAKQLAADGMAYRRILLHFYSGVELVQWSGDVPMPQATGSGSGFYAPYQPQG